MKRLSLGLALWIALVMLMGCAPRRSVSQDAAMAPAASWEGSSAEDASVVVEREMLAESPEPNAAQGVPDDSARMIIKTADVSLVVADTETAMRAVTGLVTGMGGYVSSSESWRQGEQLRANITVRIPAGELDGALEAIKVLAVRVQRESIRGQDVTEEYSDLDAQLVNLEATENELRELLAEVRQRTQKAEDILQVYRELTQIRGEIERTKGRMRYLSNLTAMATLNLELIPDILAKPVVEPGWRPLETLKNAGRALVNALKGLADALIWLVIYVLPLLLIIAIPIAVLILLIRWLVRRQKKTGNTKSG